MWLSKCCLTRAVFFISCHKAVRKCRFLAALEKWSSLMQIARKFSWNCISKLRLLKSEMWKADGEWSGRKKEKFLLSVRCDVCGDAVSDGLLCICCISLNALILICYVTECTTSKKLHFYGIRAANWPLGFHTNLKLISNDIHPNLNSAASVMKHIFHQK